MMEFRLQRRQELYFGMNRYMSHHLGSNQSLLSFTNEILDDNKIPIGSFTEDIMEKAVDLIEIWVRNNSLEGAELSTKILYRIIDENVEGNPRAYFNNAMAETILLYWRSVSQIQCPQKASELLKRIKPIREEQEMPYNEMIAVLCKCRTRNAAIFVEGLLLQMIRLQNDNRITRDMIDVVIFNSAISSWLHIAQDEADAGQRALAILNRMKGMWRIGETLIRPNLNSFSMTINALIRSEGSSSAPQVEAVLQDLLYFHDDGKMDMDGLKSIVDTVLDVMNKMSSIDPNVARISLSILRNMEKIKNLELDFKTYMFVLKALSNLGSTSIPVMEELIDDLERKYTSGSKSGPIVNTSMYNCLIKTYTKCECEKKAESLLNRMKQSFLNGNDEMKPNSMTWNLVMHAHTKSRDRASTYNASRVFQEMIKFSEKYPDVQPDIGTVTILLQVLSQKAKNGDVKAKDQAILIFDRVLASYKCGQLHMKPNKIMLSKVIDCVAKSCAPTAGSDAVKLLSRIEMFSCTNADLIIDSVIYNTVIQALANSKSEDSAATAASLLKRMKENPNPECKPTVETYTSLVNAWGNSGSQFTFTRVDEILHEVENHQVIVPNVIFYASVLNALVKCGHHVALEKAYLILQQMEEGQLKVKPNAYCFAALMDCTSMNANREEISLQVMKLVERIIIFHTKYPTDESYTVVLNAALKAIEKCSDSSKHSIAKTIVQMFQKSQQNGLLNAEFTVRTYNSFIRCCAFTTGDKSTKQVAFQAALDALTELRHTRKLKPDLYTYPAIIRALEELKGKSEETMQMVEEVFRMCCKDGMVDALVLKNLSNNLRKDLLQRLLGMESEKSQVRLNDLPPEWSRNIYDVRKRFHRQNNTWYRSGNTKPVS